MKWRCVLFQRWLPDYPDGELSPFWRRRLEAHLRVCAGCRQESAEIQEAAQIYRRHPLPMPEADFWEAFNRELHQKLAQVNQAPAQPRWRRKLPYLVGAPALAVLLVFISSYLVNQQLPGKAPRQMAERQKQEQPLEAARQPVLELAKEPAPAPAPEMGRFREAEADQVLMVHQKAPGANGVDPEQILYVGLNDGLWQEDVPSWDVEAVIADLSPQERQTLVENLSSRR
ncbi:MAG: zf-HC2 domain-containing protein [Deltaproteobacteria bacterium]|nr:zf-HC2 domain-containing protein [Deltaproteobacteria bacterium]